MAAHPNSPNGCFERHGYTVIRAPRKSGSGHHRYIYNHNGQQVLDRAGYDEEAKFCADHGLMIEMTQAPLQTA